MALERRVALVCQALHLLAPGLANVQDIEEFPTCPHPLQTNSRKIPTGLDVWAYHSITKSLLAFYDHQFASLVLFESPLLDDIKYDDLMDFIKELQPIMPNLSRYQIASEVHATLTHNPLPIPIPY